ncbi:MAG TPA: hypothetical protein PKY25_02110 [Bacilli bacterium]|nr:hypothetical protein [Bacilli bacterium]
MDSKYMLLIDDKECYIPESIIQYLGEDNFNILLNDIEDQKKYEILKRLDSLFSNYVTMSADDKYFKGRGIELGSLTFFAKKFAEKGDYAKANNQLYKSIKTFYDIHERCLEDEKEIKSQNQGMKV